MEPVTIGHLFVMIVFLPDLDDEIVRFIVPEAHEIELVRSNLARVPDLIEVRLDSHRPTEYQRIEIELIYPLLDKYRPFQHVRPYVNTDFAP